MHIIFDTSAIYPDFRMKAVSFDLLNLFRNHNYDLYFPAVVIKELNKKAEEDLRDANQKLHQVNKKVSGIFGEPKTFDISEEEIKKVLDGYEKHINNFCLAYGKIVPLPETSHEILLDGLVRGKKPFSRDGKLGYRDALIWYSILTLTRENPDEYVFITANVNDFCDEDEKLHPDLKHELGTDSSVVICKSVKQFVDEYILPALPDSQKTYADLIKKYPKLNIEEKVADELIEKTIGDEIDPRVIGLPRRFEELYLAGIAGTYDFKINVMKEIEKTKTFIGFSYEIDGLFGAEMSEDDYFNIKSEIPSLDVTHEGKFFSVMFEKEFEIQGGVVIDTSGSGSILSVEINLMNGHEF